jgi:hypothetical protein
MKKLLTKFEDMMVAVTFAEAGEHKISLSIMQEQAEEEEVGVRAITETESI